MAIKQFCVNGTDMAIKQCRVGRQRDKQGKRTLLFVSSMVSYNTVCDVSGTDVGNRLKPRQST